MTSRFREGMENKNIEWKKSWKDEYLKSVVAFANSKTGGVLRIGVDDHGRDVGVNSPKDTLKDISDTTINKLGIYPDISLDEETGVIEVAVSPSEVPIDLDGKYYVRVGNTTQELKGREREVFLSGRIGISWMDLPVDGADISQLSKVALDVFRDKATGAGKINIENLQVSDAELLSKLGLMVNGIPTRTAILLFHPNPGDVFSGTIAKIGMFDGPDLLYEDWIDCPLILMPDKILDLLNTKYTKRPVTYNGINRVDNIPYPEKALRECVMNAVMHNDYSSRIPIQIRVWEDKIMISDMGMIPAEWTMENLLSSHKSAPFNPTLARVFGYAGYVEVWGRGIEKILSAYSDREDLTPEFKAYSTSFSVILKNKAPGINDGRAADGSGKDNVTMGILHLLNNKGELRSAEISTLLGIGKDANFTYRRILPLIDMGLVERTIPDKLKSNYQRYRITPKGRMMLKERDR
jgi:ATP-dependent DNA helicase RecG